MFNINFRVSDGQRYREGNAKLVGLSRSDVYEMLYKTFPEAKEITITSIGETEINCLTDTLVERIYKTETENRTEKEVKRSVKPSAFYNIFNKDSKSLWKI